MIICLKIIMIKSSIKRYKSKFYIYVYQGCILKKWKFRKLAIENLENRREHKQNWEK